ncbi:hypothetical protein, partial [Muribaculum intestinale]|uniref:hypothetical protein n=1 Tax=Muribaculum intestinale TaxID=1796646 RepID=UPI0026DFBAA6
KTFRRISAISSDLKIVNKSKNYISSQIFFKKIWQIKKSALTLQRKTAEAAKLKQKKYFLVR